MKNSYLNYILSAGCIGRLGSIIFQVTVGDGKGDKGREKREAEGSK